MEALAITDMTIHAKERSGQRGIPHSVIDVIMQFGTPQPRPEGTQEFMLRPPDRERAHRKLKGQIQALDKARGKAVLVGNGGKVITTYHRR
jgi:hypothetical protein